MRTREVATPDVRPVGASGEVSCIELGPISAIVGETDEAEVMSTRRNMIAHTKVLEAAMAFGPILPFRFGVIAADGEDVEGMLRAQAEGLSDRLDGLDGKIEVGIKITWDRAAVMRRVVQEDPELKRAYQALQKQDETASRMARVDLGRAVHDRLAARREEEKTRHLASLRRDCIGVVAMEDSDDMTVLNAACLVDAAQEEILTQTVEGIDAEGADLYSIRYLSPVPPFNFVRIDLGRNAALAA
jgi:hypothetical protein